MMEMRIVNPIIFSLHGSLLALQNIHKVGLVPWFLVTPYRVPYEYWSVYVFGVRWGGLDVKSMGHVIL